MNRPPKNMISVTRNTHIPSDGGLELLLHAVEVVLQVRVVRVLVVPVPPMAGHAVRAGACTPDAAVFVARLANVNLPARLVVVGRLVDDRILVEVERRRRRRHRPLEALRAPRVGRRRVRP